MTKSVEAMQQQYERALERAKQEQIRIIAEQVKSDGCRVFLVQNPTHADGYYTVRLEAGAVAMTCNCEAGRRGVMCKHRAICRFWLLEEKARWQRATAPRQQRPETTEPWFAA